MTSIVVTVAQEKFPDWLRQHGPGDGRGRLRIFHIFADARPPSSDGDTLYVVACGRLRCSMLIEMITPNMGGWLVHASMIRPVTLQGFVPGFPGWRRRWWDEQHELPFDNWRTENVEAGDSVPEYAHGKTRSEHAGGSA